MYTLSSIQLEQTLALQNGDKYYNLGRMAEHFIPVLSTHIFSEDANHSDWASYMESLGTPVVQKYKLENGTVHLKTCCSRSRKNCNKCPIRDDCFHPEEWSATYTSND